MCDTQLGWLVSLANRCIQLNFIRSVKTFSDSVVIVSRFRTYKTNIFDPVHNSIIIKIVQ